MSPEEKRAAAKFGAFVQRPVNQRRVLQYGFRPGNTALAPEAPIDARHGLDPAQPKTLLEAPDPEVLAGLIERWDSVRKGAAVLVVADVSGSMGEKVPGSGGKTKLALAKTGAIGSLSEFRDDDEVGVWAFSTTAGPPEHPFYKVVAPVEAIGANRSALQDQIAALGTILGTPLYDVSRAAYDAIEQDYDPTRINAVVLLSDGDDRDSTMKLRELTEYLSGKSESSTGPTVRIFTIAYGDDADVNAMREIAKATNGAYYDATDPATIVDVLNAVVSNF